VLSHLIGYDIAILQALTDIREGRPFTWGWTYPDFDPWNESNVGPRRAQPFRAVRAELETSRAALLRDLGAGRRSVVRSDRTRGMRARARSAGSVHTSGNTPR